MSGVEEKEIKLARLRKLYAFARSKGNTRWMERIKTDAGKIKNEDYSLFDEAKKIFGLN